MIASSPTVSAQDNTAAVPTGTKQDQHNPFSFSLAKWNNFKETIPGSPGSPGKIKRQPLWQKIVKEVLHLYLLAAQNTMPGSN